MVTWRGALVAVALGDDSRQTLIPQPQPDIVPVDRQGQWKNEGLEGAKV